MVSPAFAPSKVPFLIASSPAWISPPSLKRVMILSLSSRAIPTM